MKKQKKKEKEKLKGKEIMKTIRMLKNFLSKRPFTPNTNKKSLNIIFKKSPQSNILKKENNENLTLYAFAVSWRPCNFSDIDS